MTKIWSAAVLATGTLLAAPVVTSGPFAETVTSHPEFFTSAHVLLRLQRACAAFLQEHAR